MADLTQNGDTVGHNSAAAKVVTYQGGEAIAVGNPVYLDTSTGKYSRAQADTAAKANAVGVAVTPCGADEEYFSVLLFQDGLVFEPGATLSVGEAYGVSANVGGIAPTSDWTTNDYMTQIGVATSTSQITVSLNVTGTQHP